MNRNRKTAPFAFVGWFSFFSWKLFTLCVYSACIGITAWRTTTYQVSELKKDRPHCEHEQYSQEKRNRERTMATGQCTDKLHVCQADRRRLSILFLFVCSFSHRRLLSAVWWWHLPALVSALLAAVFEVSDELVCVGVCLHMLVCRCAAKWLINRRRAIRAVGVAEVTAAFTALAEYFAKQQLTATAAALVQCTLTLSFTVCLWYCLCYCPLSQSLKVYCLHWLFCI